MDGFVGIENEQMNQSAFIQTFKNAINITQKYLTVTVDMLYSNVDQVDSDSYVKVGIVFGSGDSDSSFALNESIPITKNATDYVVGWNNGKSDLTQFIGQFATIQFELFNAVLYTFDFVSVN